MNNTKIHSKIKAQRIIAAIDFFISSVLEVLFEDEVFKKLLKTWSSLLFLIKDTNENIQVKIFNVTLHEISEQNIEHPVLLNIISYDLDILGGNPISLLVYNDAIDTKQPTHIKVLSYLSKCSANAYAPCLISLKHNIITENNIADLDRISVIDIQNNEQLEQLKQFCNEEQANFIGATISNIYIPSILYYAKSKQFLDFNIDQYKYIKTGGNFAIANIIRLCFESTGWFLKLFGKNLFSENSIPYKNAKNFNTPNIFSKHFDNISLGHERNLELYISEHKEKDLAEIGIIALCNVGKSDQCILYNLRSIKNFAETNRKKANPIYSIQYLLCVCRFIHYLKILARLKIGEFQHSADFEKYLNRWIFNYVASNLESNQELKSSYPLKSAKVKVTLDPFLENKYKCKVEIIPYLVTSSYAYSDIELETYIAK